MAKAKKTIAPLNGRPPAVARVEHFKPKAGSKPDYRCQAKGGVAEIRIFDIIDAWLGVSLQQVADDLDRAGDDIKMINVKINSDGGSVFEAIGIMNLLRGHPARVEVDISVALSAAGLIAMAGDTIRMADNGIIMLHKPWMIALGNDEELRQVADTLTKVEKAMLVPTFVNRTGLSEDEITEMMAVETWLGAEEAKEKGFVDEITGNSEPAARFDAKAWQERFHPEFIDKPKLESYRTQLATMQMVTAKMRQRSAA